MEEPILKIQNLTKTFKISRKQQKNLQTTKTFIKAVNGLSFEVRKGEIYGLLGPNGAGKTTTLRILATLISQDTGEIYLNNVSYKENISEVRKHIGFLTSELKLEDFFTPNYLFDFFADLHSLSPEFAKERKKLLFEKFGINRFKEVKIANLSTGMKQKVSLAISLLHDPEIIIFDEPTNGLDVITSRVVINYLKELRSQNKAIIISSHIFDLIEKLCDRVAIIIDGKLIIEDTKENLTKEKSLEDVFFDLYVKEVKGNE